MNEKANVPAKWLRYLLYTGIAAVLNSLLGSFLLSGLSRWLGLALSAVSIYLLFRLVGANARYKTAALFCAGALICSLLGISALTLAASVCGIVGQYQEYYGHSELIEERDPKLAGKWSSLFWLQFAVELIAGLLISLVTVIMVVAANLDAATVTASVTVAISIVSMILRVLYLIYLHRTIKTLENEFVM